MKRVSIITESSLNKLNGNVARPKWEFESIKKNGFKNIQLVGNFSQKVEEGLKDDLIHAQQLSGNILKNSKFITDVHGLEYFQSENLARGYSNFSWRKWRFKNKAKHWKKIELEVFKKSQHLICAGESILEKVEKIQNATLVRNSLNLENFLFTTCKEMNVGLVGPFIPGKINYLSINIMKEIFKKLPKINFTIIGKTDKFFRETLNFKNVKFTGETLNYLETLRNCSVLLAPYPEYAYYLGSKNKILEAAACKIPIITSKRGAIDFNNKLLLIGESADQLIEKILYLKNENIRKELGNQLRCEIEQNHNAEKESKKIIKIYNEFLD